MTDCFLASRRLLRQSGDFKDLPEPTLAGELRPAAILPNTPTASMSFVWEALVFCYNERNTPDIGCLYLQLASANHPKNRMIEADFVARYFAKLPGDSDEALADLSRGYYEKLATIARSRLGSFPRRVTDEYAIANSVLQAFHQRALQGEFAHIQQPAELLLVFSQLTRDRVVDEIRRGTAQKRGAGKTRGHSIFVATSGLEKRGDFDRFAGEQETPSARETFAEEVQGLLDQLPDATLRAILVLRLDGLTNEEISEQLELSLATIERKRRQIRQLLGDISPDQAKSL